MIISFLLRRYLLPREGNLLSFVLWVSVLGVALGIAVLILVLGVMSGFQEFLEERYTRITSDIVVLPRNTAEKVFPPGTDLGKILSSIDGVRAVSPFQMGQGMIFAGGVGGAVLEGIDLLSMNGIVSLKDIFYKKPDLELQRSVTHWIWLGKGLSEKLKVGIGDEVSVMMGEGEKGTVQFKVTGITKFGIYDHDKRYAYIALPLLNEYFQKGEGKPLYKIRLNDRAELDQVAARLLEKVGLAANVRKWSEINQNVFLAVTHQKHMLFIVLEILVALAGVNVINLLMMSSYYRRRDTAILRAMGMRAKSVLVFFILQGAAVGVVGVGAGVALGLLLCEAVKLWHPEILSESVYNVTQLPVRVMSFDLLLICSVAFLLCIIFSVIPAVKAAYARPVESLRMD